MDILQQLRDLGLYVHHSQPDNGKAHYYIFEPLEGYTADNMMIYVDIGEEIQLVQPQSKTFLMIFEHDNDWELCLSEGVPGPGPDDFTKAYDTENEALAAALEYFTGEPTLIDGWSVPLHRHLQIKVEQTRQAIQSAQKITEAEFKLIKKEYASRRFRPDFEGSDFACVFLEVPHQTDEQLVLHLRRDGQEAFVVEKG